MVGTVLMLNYNDLADPLSELENTMLGMASDWTVSWNQICGIGVASPSFPLYCTDADEFLLNDTVAAQADAYVEGFIFPVSAETASDCHGFVVSLQDQQDNYRDAVGCQFGPLGTTVTGIFVLVQLFFGLAVFMPSVKPEHDDGVTRADPTIDSTWRDTVVAVFCGTMYVSAKYYTKTSTKRLLFVLLFLAQAVFCGGYCIILFYFGHCYANKKMFHWFFICMCLVCLINAFLMAVRWRQERVYERLIAQQRALESASASSSSSDDYANNTHNDGSSGHYPTTEMTAYPTSNANE
ncbi:hypothetical protein Pelo_5448 [Pelomyxa schiedti]|nr:hypothetical protein Pelo_5448 [Pelomyxa schiedti]